MQILGSPALTETIRLVDVFLQARTALAAMLPKTVMVRYKKWQSILCDLSLFCYWLVINSSWRQHRL